MKVNTLLVLVIAALVGACTPSDVTELPAQDVAGSEAETGAPSASGLVDSRNRVLGEITGEIVAANRAMDETMNLVARLEVQENELLEFYEPAPGHILLSIAGRPSKPLLAQGYVDEIDDYRMLWQMHAPEDPIPQTLEAAIARRDARRAERARLRGESSRSEPAPTMLDRAGGLAMETPEPVTALAPASQTIGGSANASPTAWCNTTWFTIKPSFYSPYALGDCPSQEWKRCYNSITNSYWASHADIERLWASVCPFVGSVLFCIDADESWVSEGCWDTPFDSSRSVRISDPGCDEFPYTNDCVYIRMDITNALNDAYNVRFVVSED